jgi:hypothetical protein
LFTELLVSLAGRQDSQKGGRAKTGTWNFEQ